MFADQTESKFIDENALIKRRERLNRRIKKGEDYPISGYGNFRVFWLPNVKGREHRSPRFYLYAHAKKLLELMQIKHGKSNAIIYAD